MLPEPVQAVPACQPEETASPRGDINNAPYHGHGKSKSDLRDAAVFRD